MNITGLDSLSSINGLESVSRYNTTRALQEQAEQSGVTGTSFDSLLNSAMQMIKETDDYTNAVEEEEIKYATGQSSSMHDLMIAQQKASVSLQYTVAVKNTAVEAYKSLMNMQF
ncbi:MAG: flagellar hook-basal body complex protein FliE [Eubacterium sp.]|nr:flagellar hook-basal body complex protein FliE [Eubacterium sp.]